MSGQGAALAEHLACVELRDLKLETHIGTYGPHDIVPDEHLLDLTLWIDSTRVLIDQDGMEHVFDYDPLVLEVSRLAGEGHYQTQERLMTRIVDACARCPEIAAMEISLRKTPVRAGSGSLGIRLLLDETRFAGLRQAALTPASRE